MNDTTAPVRPVRMCVGCRRRRPARDLLRFVRSQAGDVEFGVELDGMPRAGRGAWLCPNPRCATRAAQSGVFISAFRTPGLRVEPALLRERVRMALVRRLWQAVRTAWRTDRACNMMAGRIQVPLPSGAFHGARHGAPDAPLCVAEAERLLDGVVTDAVAKEMIRERLEEYRFFEHKSDRMGDEPKGRRARRRVRRRESSKHS